MPISIPQLILRLSLNNLIIVDNGLQSGLLQYRFMQNYERLFKQLTQLLQDENVQQSIDQSLSQRVNAILLNQKRYEMRKQSGEICMSDSDQESLFDRPRISEFKVPSLSIPLKNNINLLNKESKEKTILRSNSKEPTKSKNKSIIRYKTQVYEDQKPSKSKGKHPQTKKAKNASSTSHILINKPRQTQLSRRGPKPQQKQNINRIKAAKAKQQNCRRNEHENRSSSGTKNSYHTSKSKCRLRTEPATAMHHEQRLAGSKEKQFLQHIQKKDMEVNLEKAILEDKVRKLKEQIEEEKAAMEEIERSIHTLNAQINKTSYNSRTLSQSNHKSKKKLQHCFTETKEIKKGLEDANSQNATLVRSIQEEKELIDMYLTVINEMKSQIKIEKKERKEAKAKLALLKKNEVATKHRSDITQASTAQLLRNVQTSLNKWT